MLGLWDKIGEAYGEISEEERAADCDMLEGSGTFAGRGDGDDVGVVPRADVDSSRVVRYDSGLVSIGRVSMRLLPNLTIFEGEGLLGDSRPRREVTDGEAEDS